MAASDDLINFDVIEDQKENIQALPSGRSAKKLAELFSPSPLQKRPSPTSIGEAKSVNDRIRAEYEAEIENIAESDDPLDVWDRYVRWTLDAYPSAQATGDAQLRGTLERATKAFVGAAQYRNDPRYLKIWLLYIGFFSDAPRETYVYLSRHGVGEGLALYYEEYAAWLEGAGRWGQAEEVYRLGIDREARPAMRLTRKFKEFEERRAHREEVGDEPSSPALPTARPALAAKAPAPNPGLGTSGRPARAKLAVFSDADAAPSQPALSSRGTGSKGWDSIGTLGERRKENTVEPTPWAGETLKAGGKKRAGPKMEVFKDKSLLSQISHFVVQSSEYQVTVNPVTGKRERIFVDLATLYPTPEIPGSELSFEEIWARNRGWLDRPRDEEESDMDESVQNDENSPLAFASSGHGAGVDTKGRGAVGKLAIHRDPAPAMYDENSAGRGATGKGVSQKLVIHRDSENDVRGGASRGAPQKLAIHQDSAPAMYDENGAVMEAPRVGKSKKMRRMEVNETQTIKAKLDSPSRPKLKKRGSAEPTMTLHTKAATDDIYDIFNQPVAKAQEDEESDDDDDYDSDGDYTSGAESTNTTRQIGGDLTEVGYDGSEPGDETEIGDETEVNDDDDTSDVKSVSEWSDFSTRRHVPNVDGDLTAEQGEDDDASDLIDTSDPDPSGGISERTSEQEEYDDGGHASAADDEASAPRTRTTFVPIPPEDWEPHTRPFRDPVEVANNRLPFMTPITERTEVSMNIPMRYEDSYKTPSRRNELATPRVSSSPESEFSSPLVDVDSPSRTPPRAAVEGIVEETSTSPTGPIIQNAQCNPVDDVVRDEILANIHPPLSAYPGFYDRQGEKYEKGSEIRRFAKAMTKAQKAGDKTNTMAGPVIHLPDIDADYAVKKELGAGAFAPVYLVENSSPDEEEEKGVGVNGAVTRRSAVEALKMEVPPSAWEFYIMRQAHERLGAQHRAAASLSHALEVHVFQDEGFLVLPYHPHGTLLDVVNSFRAEPSGVMDEQLAMFFAVELLRTAEALHSRGLMHGDLKPDNCLLRLDHGDGDSPLSAQYRPDGEEGWGSRGVTLIDFGRGVDMRAFAPGVSFVADWKTTAQDCAEMREGRPWTWQMDYHGLAGVLHCLLFGRYIETVRADAGGVLGPDRRYRVRESLKRYWQTGLWGRCFDMLLNPAAHAAGEEDGRMPLLRGMRDVREEMEAWLVANCERGVGLKGLLGKVEAFARRR
ncbi:related to mitotic checkpoint serine/threonine protein kinase [Cephalotrichum gorgonifer]|uniref:Related to mitotic checkpoint serine/threonine protein kinase n=1 Tax=Cephalotrichum gorgonifer TaxID=2041049 RepID=A0AAE8MP84_9PEZI|nr:related to mitotic checkpoint serine/threonine protein kinase [Cephalotrichum gorgonifer]